MRKYACSHPWGAARFEIETDFPELKKLEATLSRALPMTDAPKSRIEPGRS